MGSMLRVPSRAAALAAMTELDELAAWFDAALTANSLDDFRAAVGQ